MKHTHLNYAEHRDDHYQQPGRHLDDLPEPGLPYSPHVHLKRLGYLVETLALALPDREEHLARRQHALAPGIVALQPGAATEPGRSATRWQLRVNVSEPWSVEEEA